MSAEEFWKDDPQLFISYRTSFVNKKEREIDEFDYKCWLQGLYIHDGNNKLFASLKQFFGNLFASMFKGTKDHTKIETYPIMPYRELEKEKQKEEQKKIKNQKYKDYEKSLIHFGTLKQQYLDRLKKKGE